MTEIQVATKLPKQLATELERIGSLEDTTELRTLLVRSLGVTVEQVILMAAIVRRLEELGDDLTDLEISVFPLIRKVAYGQIVPELLVRLQGKPSLLRRAASMPLPDQRGIANGEPLKVIQPGGDHRMIPPLKLTAVETRQVFASDHIRDEAEQAAWLREREQNQPVKPPDSEEIYLDRKRQGIVVAGRFISASDLAHYLSQLTVPAKSRRQQKAVR